MNKVFHYIVFVFTYITLCSSCIAIITVIRYIVSLVQWKFSIAATLGAAKKWPLQKIAVIENVLIKYRV